MSSLFWSNCIIFCDCRLASEKRKRFRQQRDRLLNRFLTVVTCGYVKPLPPSRRIVRKQSLLSCFRLFTGERAKNSRVNSMASVKVLPLTTAVLGAGEDINAGSKVHLLHRGNNKKTRSNFSRSLANLEMALEELEKEVPIPETPSLSECPSLDQLSESGTAPIDIGQAIRRRKAKREARFNQTVSIVLENSFGYDWFAENPHRSSLGKVQESLTRRLGGVSTQGNSTSGSSFRPKSLFFRVNGKLVHLSETNTTVSHC